ncbi:type IV secretion system protein [Neisseria sicca]|uniref:type IV secretion system protein n=1 Tax=Neisseria sicca TaxID=490 RepID=UPI0028EF545F|nr:type IV secretion system protein [Neisseria sicca]
MAEKSTFFVDMTQFITDNMGSNLFDTASNLISNVAPVFSTMFGIYLLMIMVSYWSGGGLDEMFVDFLKRMITMTFLVTLAFNASYYAELANLIYVLPDDLAKALSNTDYAGGALDKVMDDTNVAVETLELQKNKLDFYEVGPIWTYIIAIWQLKIAMMILLGVMFAYYILAKVSLAMILMIGPVFIGFGMFPATRQYAMNWVGQCLNYIFNVVLLAVIGSMMLKFTSIFIDLVGVDNIGAALATGTVLLFTLIVFVLLIWMTPQISSALTGGSALQGAMRTVYNMARKSLSKADYGANKAKGYAAKKYNALKDKLQGNGIKPGK